MFLPQFANIFLKGIENKSFNPVSLKKTPKQYNYIILLQNFNICFISWHILIKNIKLSAILD